MSCPDKIPSYAEFQALKNEIESLKRRVTKIEQDLSEGLEVDITSAIKTALKL